jgi:hypothetical protein
MFFRIIFVLFFLIFFQTETLSTYAASESYCEKIYAHLFEDQKPFSYTWDEKSSKKHISNMSRSPPPSYSAEIVNIYHDIRGKVKTSNPMSNEDFKNKFPHSIDDMKNSQTTVHFDNDDYLVESYDETTGAVALFREQGFLSQGVRKKTSNKSQGPVPTEDFFFEDIGKYLKEIKVGDIVTGKYNIKYEVRNVDEYGHGRIYYRTIQKQIIDINDFLQIKKAKEKEIYTPKMISSSENRKNRSKSFSPFSNWIGIKKPGTTIQLVGKKGFTRSSETKLLTDSFYYSRKEINIRNVINDILENKYPENTKISLGIENQVDSLIVGDKNGEINVKYSLKTFLASRYFYIDMLKIETPNGKIPLIIKPRFVPSQSGKSELTFFDESSVETISLKYLIKDGEKNHEINLQFPDQKNDRSNKRLKNIADELMASLPLNQADSSGLILLENGEDYLKMANAYAHNDKDTRKISLLGNHLEQPISRTVDTFWHETGHSIALKLWNSDYLPSIEWERAMSLDGRFVSGYAMTNKLEDFAETVKAYIKTDGGRLNPKLREIYSSRFMLLDRVFAVSSDSLKLEEIIAKKKRELGIGASAIVVGGVSGVYYFYTDREN